MEDTWGGGLGLPQHQVALTWGWGQRGPWAQVGIKKVGIPPLCSLSPGLSEVQNTPSPDGLKILVLTLQKDRKGQMEGDGG